MVGGLAWADDSLTHLEEVTVYAPQAGGPTLGGVAITQADMQRFERNTLDQALLLGTGTSVTAVGPRNETDIWLRGFDRWRVPLLQDGIPIYLPYDNRIDFGRFTTIDLAQVQVSKGFASVIDGPGAMGGSVNLVSRVVSAPLEVEARYGAQVDSDGRYEGELADLFVGTRRNGWFAQVAGAFSHSDGFRLSDDFTAGTLQPPGVRISSYHQDYKINVKAGFQSSDGQEYSVNFIDQVGQKGNPPPDSVIPPANLSQARFWSWPSWDKQSAYWLSRSVLDAAGSYLKTRVYYDRFYNVLDSFDSITYSTMNLPRAFISTYDDRAAGASVELAEVLAGGRDTVRVAAHFRWDQHNQTQFGRNTATSPQYQQPWQTAQENTSSLALENIYRPVEALQLIAGVSFDYRHLIGDSEWLAAGTTPPYGSSFAYPVADKHAFNGEVAAIYSYSATGSVHLSYADRVRFPTLFEMYSTRFSTFKNNPDLQPERSHYAQIGVKDTLAGTQVAVNVFFARIDDAITSVVLPPDPQNPQAPAVSQSQNIGAERQAGYEIELSRALLPQLSAGINYSALSRVELSGATVPLDTPSRRLFAYLDFHPLPQLAIIPSIDMEGPRWLQGAVNPALTYHTGSYAVAALKASYAPFESFSVDIGATNLLDRNYVIEDGYHAPGREYFANVRVRL